MATFTPAYSSGIPTVEETTQVDSDSPFVDDDQGPHDGRDSHEVSATEKLACDRCRRRKIKCDRVHPCAHCVKARLQCTYDLGQKPRAKRQRVLISSVYESRMEQISKKIDDLTEMMSRLSPAHLSIGDTISTISPHRPPTPSPWHPSTLTQPPRTNIQAHERRNHQALTEADAIEPSLFSQAVFATKFLQAVLAHDPFSPVASEMTSVLESLRDIVEAQNRRNNLYDVSNPFSKTLPPGHTIRDLPLPLTGKIMACLRLAKVQSYFFLQFKSLGHFTEYVIKACSPGPITDAELIIVHLGLYWLFYECSGVSTDVSTKHDYAAQACICKESLEIILSNLSFHAPTTIDYVHAMHLAAVYCLQMNKPNAAWAFISKASLLGQAMGIQNSIAMISEVAEERQHRARLFWAVYCMEKAISLRLGRSSTIRDHDITIPRPLSPQRTASPWHNSLPDGIEISNLFSRVFDDLYSPSALVQPVSVRSSRAKALSAELEQRIASRAVSDIYSQELLGQLIDPKVLVFLRHADTVCNYSVLASIYKSIPPGDPSSSSSPECISAARVALQEHVTCISLVADHASECLILDFWVNAALLLSPFIPFNILFCNIVETSECSDLQLLGRFVGALELSAAIPRYSASCRRQLPIFRSLYDVAAKYLEAKAKGHQQHPSPISNVTELGMETIMRAEASASMLNRTKQPEMPKDASQDSINEIPDDFGVEMDLSSAEIGDWFYQSHQMMRLLEEG